MIIGWLRRRVPFATKLEDCGSCSRIAPHVMVRQTTWFTFFWVPVVLLWFRHGLICGNCGAFTGVSWRRFRHALRSGSLHLDRQRPRYAALRLEDPYTYPSDPARYFDPIQRRQGRSLFDLYTRAWPILAALLVVLVVVNPARTMNGGRAPTPEIGQGWDSLAVGSCYNDSAVTGATVPPLPSGATTADSSVTLVSCDQPHAFEVYGVRTDDTGSEVAYPGEAALSDAAQKACDDAFLTYTGLPYEASALETQIVYPSAGGWTQGFRNDICSLYDPSSATVRGSQKGQWVRFHSPDRTYSISYPSGWTQSVTNTGILLLASGSSTEVRVDQASTTSAKALLTADMSELDKAGVVFDAGTSDYPVNGVDWYMVPYHIPSAARYGLDCAAVVGQLQVVISWTSTGRAKADLDLLDLVVRSFRDGRY